MTHRPYPETPEAAARNLRAAQVSIAIDVLAAGNEAHARRARVRVAGLYPPTGPGPSDDDVRAVVAATAPVQPPTSIEPPATEETDAA